MTPDQEKKLNDVHAFMESMKRFDKIPLDVKLALARKLDLQNVTVLRTSTKTASSENQSVDEGGVATYNVLGAPNGFLQVNVGGGVKYIAYYT